MNKHTDPMTETKQECLDCKHERARKQQTVREAKDAAGYITKPACCRECKHVGYKDSNFGNGGYYCDLGRFSVRMMGHCKHFERKGTSHAD
jgi:hypothetical protein